MYTNKIIEIARLKEAIDKFRPLKKSELVKLKDYYRIKLTYTSNALEGNSLTETETKIVLEEGIAIGGKQLKDHLEVLGHNDAYDYMYTLAKHATIDEKDILKLHKLFYIRINPKLAGKYRKQQVFITGTDFIPPAPKQVPTLMKEFAEKISSLKNELHPVQYAAELHLRLVSIHPFVDGNGRTARLLMNVALLQAGYIITLIPKVSRVDYITALKQSQLTKDSTPFVNFITAMVYESTNEYVRLITAMQ